MLSMLGDSLLFLFFFFNDIFWLQSLKKYVLSKTLTSDYEQESMQGYVWPKIWMGPKNGLKARLPFIYVQKSRSDGPFSIFMGRSEK